MPDPTTLPASPDLLAPIGPVEPELGSLKPAELDVLRLFRELAEAGTPQIYRKLIAAIDDVVAREALSRVGGNQVHASALLGISRTTLRAKLKNKVQEPAAVPTGSAAEHEGRTR